MNLYKGSSMSADEVPNGSQQSTVRPRRHFDACLVSVLTKPAKDWTIRVESSSCQSLKLCTAKRIAVSASYEHHRGAVVSKETLFSWYNQKPTRKKGLFGRKNTTPDDDRIKVELTFRNSVKLQIILFHQDVTRYIPDILKQLGWQIIRDDQNKNQLVELPKS